jgi:hypothetical protein
MSRRLGLLAMLLVCASALGAEKALVLYQIDLVPSGRLIASDVPTLKGTTYVFHKFPTGTLISVRKSEVKKIFQMTPEAVASVNPKTKLVRIGNLAMEGPRTDGTAGIRMNAIGRARVAAADANAGTAARTASPPD